MKRALSLAATAAVIAGLLVAAAPPAFAAQPVAVKNFHPNDEGFPGATGVTVASNVLSDRDDGSGAGAHLTTVTTVDAERVTWYHCNSNVFTPPGNTLTQQELDDPSANGCTQITPTDTTPVRPPVSSGTGDAAWDINWDIPAGIDRTIRDIAAVACIGVGNRIEPFGNPAVPANCRIDVENDVIVDDASTPTAGSAVPPVSPQPTEEQTSAGEITQICTADNFGGGPGDINGNRTAPDQDTFAEDPCEVDPAGTDVAAPGSPERAAIDARFRAFPHGSAVPSNGFVFRATTDPSIAQGGGVLFWSIGQGDANALGSATTNLGPCTSLSGVAGTNLLWECIVPGAVVSAGQERSLTIFDQASSSTPSPGAGYCDPLESGEDGGPQDNPSGGGDKPNCQLDVHYATVVSRDLASVKASFQPGNGAAANAGCDTGEAPDTDESNSIEAGSDPATNNGRELVVACFKDQLGDPVASRTVFFQSVGPKGSGIFGCLTDERFSPAVVSGQGSRLDDDADGRFDRCTTTTGATGEATALINNISSGTIVATPGDQTLRACATSCATASPATQASVVVHWAIPPHHVHLVHADTGTTDDPCHTGLAVKEFFVGQKGTLIACVFDANHLPAPTTAAGAGRVSWAYTPPTNTASPASSVDPQPSETDANGRAAVTFTAIRQGSDFITVSLEKDDGTLQCPSTDTVRCRATVEIRVIAGTTTTSPSTSPVRQTRSVNLESSSTAVDPGSSFVLSGNIVASDPVCYAAQTVTIVRTPIGGGTEETVGTLTSGSDGVFSGTFSGRAGVYTARLAETAACSAATSSTVTLKEKVVLALTTSRSTIRKGRRVKLTATLTPCTGHSGTPVAFFASTRGGGFGQMREKTLNSSCSASMRKKLRRTKTFQARWAPDNDHAAGVSPTRRVRVKKRSGDTSGGGGGF